MSGLKKSPSASKTRPGGLAKAAQHKKHSGERRASVLPGEKGAGRGPGDEGKAVLGPPPGASQQGDPPRPKMGALPPQGKLLAQNLIVFNCGQLSQALDSVESWQRVLLPRELKALGHLSEDPRSRDPVDLVCHYVPMPRRGPWHGVRPSTNAQ